MRKLSFLLGFLFWVIVVTTANASVTTPITTSTGGKLVLEEESTVVIRTWPGEAACDKGELILVEPKLKLIYSSPSNVPPKSDKTPTPTSSPDQIIIYNYGLGLQRVEIGPYPAGTEIVLAIKPKGMCKEIFYSNDIYHASIDHNGGESWTLSWEDYNDKDFNDVYTEVSFIPTSKDSIETEITATRVFSQEPVYKLPWPAGIKHKFTVLPGVDEHEKTRAFDIDMKIGDRILASEMGLVLWVEDSFGSGSCNPRLRNRTNVVVIQTEVGVNLTYVHLQKGSVQAAGIKVGDIVKQGQWIGNAGNSGYVCSDSGNGSHLHIEWQHNCYDLTLAIKKRTLPRYKVGQPTLTWSCPSFSPKSPFSFSLEGKLFKVRKNKDYVSDNIQH